MDRRSFLKLIPGLGVAAVVPAVIASGRVPPAKKFVSDVRGGPLVSSTTETVNLNAELIEGNLLTKQYQHFPMKMSDWKPVRHGQQ